MTASSPPQLPRRRVPTPRRIACSRTNLLAVCCLILLAATSGCTDPPGSDELSDDATRQAAVDTIRGELDNVENDTKVRAAAADALVRLEHEVNLTAFADGDAIPGDTSPDAWLVLARAAAMPGRKPQTTTWLDACFAGLASDSLDLQRQCAAPLARLADTISLNESQRQQLAGLAANATDPELRAYLAWAAAQAADAKAGASAHARLVDLLTDDATRYIAAEALIALPTLPPEDKAKPAGIMGDSVAAQLVRLAHTDDADQTDADRQDVYQAATAGTTDDQLLLAQLLATGGGVADRELLKTLGKAESPRVRIAAAAAICQIERRVPRQLSRLDWCVIAAYVLGMLAIGWYFSRKSSTSDDYLLGGRQMKSGAVGLSLFATMLSTITYLSSPGEMIRNGPMLLCAIASYPLIILIIGWGLIPYLRRLQITSAYELLEDRFGLGVRMLGSTFFLMLRLLWMSVIIYATTDKVLVPLLGIDPSYTPLVGATLGVITIIYTTMGGLQAVVWTDVVQTGVLFFGAILSVIVINSNLGGVDQWWPNEWAPSWQPFTWFDPKERISFFGITLAVITWQVCTNGSDQMAIQRYLSCSSDQAARRAQWTAMAADAAVALLLGTLGFALFAFFTTNPHLLPGGATLRAGADQLLPRFVVIGLPQGISGLVVAGLLAAAMSSLSSGVNSSSSVITVDFIERFSRKKFTDRAQVRVARIVSVVVGVVVVSLSMMLASLANSTFGNLFEIAYKVVNFFTAPLFGLFFMAFFVRWATTIGTFAGAAAGLAVAFGINYWEVLTDAPRSIGFIWALPLSLISQIIVGCLVSAIERAVRGSK